MAEILQKGRKHCGDRRNCSLQAISPSPTVFSRVVLQTRKNQGLFGKGLNIAQMIRFVFAMIENIMGKKHNAGLCYGPVSVVHPSVHVSVCSCTHSCITFILNIFFETTFECVNYSLRVKFY